MNSSLLVFLALLSGAAVGAGLAVSMQPPGPSSIEAEPFPAAADGSSDAEHNAVAAKLAGKKPGGEVRDDAAFQKLASALLSIDERLSAMEARDEMTAAKQKKLIDDVRELAIHLEVRSGELEPLLDANARQPLQPVPTQAGIYPITGASPLPFPAGREPALPLGMSQGAENRAADSSPGEEGLPEW